MTAEEMNAAHDLYAEMAARADEVIADLMLGVDE